MIKQLFVITIITLSFCIITSCVNKVPYPQQKQFMLNVAKSHKMTSKYAVDVLEVSNVSIVSQFADTSFVYRISNTRYVNDFYNTFFKLPDQQIKQTIVNYFNNTGLFHYVLSDNALMQPDYILNANVIALYADYRQSSHPKAIMTIEFTLFKFQVDDNHILMQKTLTQSIPLAKKDTQSLVNGWGTGLSRMLRTISMTVKKIF